MYRSSVTFNRPWCQRLFSGEQMPALWSPSRVYQVAWRWKSWYCLVWVRRYCTFFYMYTRKLSYSHLMSVFFLSKNSLVVRKVQFQTRVLKISCIQKYFRLRFVMRNSIKTYLRIKTILSQEIFNLSSILQVTFRFLCGRCNVEGTKFGFE